MTQTTSPKQANQLEQYYRFHAKLYDATRWSFLFGRQAIIHLVAQRQTPANILEVGCGTGKNLLTLAQTFPEATITGLDLSEDMLTVARRNLSEESDRVNLLHVSYNKPLNPTEPYDLILFSYALTMFNPGWDTAIDHAQADLAVGGAIAVVDFHDSPMSLFKRWMGVNHVRMDGHLQPKLETLFEAQLSETKSAYGGLWRYLLYIGKKAER